MFLRNKSALLSRAAKRSSPQTRFSPDWRTKHILGRQVDTVRIVSLTMEVVNPNLPVNESPYSEDPGANVVGGDYKLNLIADWINKYLHLYATVAPQRKQDTG